MNLRILQINCLDLFIFLDQSINKDLEHYSEEEWQSLTYSQKGNKPLDKTNRLAHTLLESDADVICLNEVGGEESLINFNKYFLKDRYVIAMAEGSSNRCIDTGFLVRKGIDFEINGFKAVNLNNRTFRFSRSINNLSIKDQGKTVLNIFGVHLKSKRSGACDPKTIEIRFNEVRGLTQIMSDIHKKTNVPYILMGDMNGDAGLNNREFEFDTIYDETTLKDIHDINDTPNLDRYSFVRFEYNDIKYSQLDYIFLSGDLHDKIKKVKRWLYQKDNQDVYVTTMTEKFEQPSDHYPQMVEIKLKND